MNNVAKAALPARLSAPSSSSGSCVAPVFLPTSTFTVGRPAPRPLGPKGGEPQAARAVFATALRSVPGHSAMTSSSSPTASVTADNARSSASCFPSRPGGRAPPRQGQVGALCRRRGAAGGAGLGAAEETAGLYGSARKRAAVRRARQSLRRGRRLGVGAARAGRLCWLRARRCAAARAARDNTSCQRAGHIRLPGCRHQVGANHPPQHECRIVGGRSGRAFLGLNTGRLGYCPACVGSHRFARDFVAVAERFIGTPYLWGGRTRLGLDCSGFVQVALEAAARKSPRDSDMQQAALGVSIPVPSDLEGLERGDLVFWPRHVGVMVDSFMLLHANAHHMAVAVEPLSDAAERIARLSAPVTTIRRLATPARAEPTSERPPEPRLHPPPVRAENAGRDAPRRRPAPARRAMPRPVSSMTMVSVPLIDARRRADPPPLDHVAIGDRSRSITS